MNQTWQTHPLVKTDPITAPSLILDEPLSMWGGLDAETGEIIDRRHPQSGEIVSGKVLILPSGRGSSSASSVMLEAVKVGTAPVAIVTAEIDGILALAAVVAQEIYGKGPAVHVLPEPEYTALCAAAENALVTVSLDVISVE